MERAQKPECSGLTDEQHINLTGSLEYFMSLADDKEDLETIFTECKEHIYSIETLSFITPLERRTYIAWLCDLRLERKKELNGRKRNEL